MPGMVATAVRQWLDTLGFTKANTPQRRLRAERTVLVQDRTVPAPRVPESVPELSLDGDKDATSDEAPAVERAPAAVVEHQAPVEPPPVQEPPAPAAPSSAEMVAKTPAAVDGHAEPAAPTKSGKSFLAHARTVTLWLRDVGLGTSGYVLLVVVVTAGFTASFIALHQFGLDRMSYSDDQAWLVPVAIDGADIGLSVSALRAAMDGRSAFVVRLMIVACTSISSGINYSHITDWLGRRVAALLPILAVILLESLMAEARQAHERRTGNVRPRLSLLRWVFDFKGTWAILRAYHLGIPLPDRMVVAAEIVAAEKEAAKPRSKHHRRRTRKAKATETEGPAKAKPEPPEDTKDGDVNDLAIPGRPDWLTDSMVAKDALWGYLDRNGPPPGLGAGAKLTRWLKACGYEVNDDYGRNMLGRWKRETGHVDEPVASGQG